MTREGIDPTRRNAPTTEGLAMNYELVWLAEGKLDYDTFDEFSDAMRRAGHLAVNAGHKVLVRKLEKRGPGYFIIWSIKVEPST